MASGRRVVRLRAERIGEDSRFLDAYVDDAGLHIDGQDLGPGTAMVSDDGEYEWFETYAPADIPRIVELLGGEPGTEILDLLEQHWYGDASHELERRLRQSDIPVTRHVW